MFGFGKKKSAEERDKKYFPEDKVEELLKLSSTDTALKVKTRLSPENEEVNFQYLMARRNLWLFIEEIFPETREGAWTLSCTIHPYIYRSND